jgi:hypothetical protein
MFKRSVICILLPLILLTHCSSKENRSKEKEAVKAATITSFPNPDTESFFPLLPKSAWHYEQFMEGTFEPGNTQIDSVIDVSKNDSGILCNMVKMVAGSKDQYYSYLIKSDSIITMLDNSKNSTLFCSLFPVPGTKICDLTYSSFLNSENTKIRLETSNIETATEQQQMEWQGKVFEKGIGLISFGGSTLEMSLTEYHLGDEPVKKTR